MFLATEFQSLLRNNIIFVELLASIVGILNLNKFKNTNWKYFIYYLLLIFVFEAISFFFLDNYPIFKKYYFHYLVIPFQFVFFYWLYAINSLKKKKIFYLFLSIYLIILYLSEMFHFNKTRIINEVSYSVGCLLLFILIIMEFLKQIKSDNILKFKQNFMFYINFGVTIFYIGTLPFFALDGYSFTSMKYIWSYYWTAFLISNYILYSFYIAGFIWAKPSI